MPPFVCIPDTTPVLEPVRLVMVPLKCFYCDHSVEEDIYEWRITHLFGLFHCSEHTAAAERDCTNFMRSQGIVRIRDAGSHPVLGPFLTALGNSIPVLRSSGQVDTDWYIPVLNEVPTIKWSNSTNVWGFNLTNGSADKFIPLSQFRDPRVVPHMKEEAMALLDSVEQVLVSGFYGP
jgi:hypothetical protein